MTDLGLNLPKMGKKLNIAVWALLLSLTVAILLYPVKLQFEFMPVQSVHIFQNLPVFCIIYVVWLASLSWLLLGLDDGRKANWLRIALVAIFAVVYLGFWAVITPHGFTVDYEGGALSYSSYILGGGEIKSAMSGMFGYFQFPFTAFLGAGLSWITGLSLLDVRMAVLLFGSVLFGVAMFVFLKNTMKNAGLASVAAILVMQGSLVLSHSLRFYPVGIGLILFALFLMFLVKNKGLIFESLWSKAIAVVLMVAITTNHYITSFYVVGVLVAIYLVHLIGKKKLIKPLFIIPLVVIPILWGVFWATPTVDYIFGRTTDVTATIIAQPPENPETDNEIVEAETGGSNDIIIDEAEANEIAKPPSLSLWWVGTMMTSYLGVEMPLWGKAIIVFWVLMVYVFGGVLVLVNLFRLRKLDTANTIFTGGMLGVVAVSALAVFATLRLGGYEFFRFLQFGSFFAIPIVASFLWSLSRFRRQIMVFVVVVLLFALSLPTFLIHNNTIEADAVYPQEAAAYEFLEDRYGDGEGVGIFTSEMACTVSMFYLPNAEYYINACLVYTPKDVFYNGVEPMLEVFDQYEGEKVFVYSERFYWYYYHIYGITVDNPKWVEFRGKLDGLEKIYDNGFVQIYK